MAYGGHLHSKVSHIMPTALCCAIHAGLVLAALHGDRLHKMASHAGMAGGPNTSECQRQVQTRFTAVMRCTVSRDAGCSSAECSTCRRAATCHRPPWAVSLQLCRPLTRASTPT